jgi:hypothetical protein
LQEINSTYKQATTKKNKEILLHNLQNIIKMIKEKVAISSGDLERAKVEYR